MRNLLRSLLFPLLLASCSFSPALANNITIQGVDPGGEIGDHLKFWEYIADAGDNIIIDGACASACTLFLGKVPLDRVCMTDRASLGVHLAASPEGEEDKEGTILMQRTFYPQWINDWIAKQPPLTLDVIWMLPRDIIPNIKMCEGFTAPPEPPKTVVDQPASSEGTTTTIHPTGPQ